MMKKLALLLMPTGLAAIVLGLSKYHATYVDERTYDFTESTRLGWAIGTILLLIAISYAVGLPDPPRGSRIAVLKPMLVGVSTIAIVSAVQFILSDQILPRFVVVGAGVLAVPWLMACSVLMGAEHRRRLDADRILVLGDTDEEELRAEIALGPERALTLVGARSPDAIWGTAEATDPSPLLELIDTESITVIVLDRVAQEDQRIALSAAIVHGRGTRVRTLLAFYEEWLGKLPVSELQRSALLFDIAELHRLPYQRMKRMIDLAVAIPLALLLVVLLPFIALGNLVANRGPLFFTQERIGKGGEPFTIYKLRSMRRTTPSPGSASEWTGTDDMRVTPFGRVLRVTHLDELPQVLNILKGDLSIIGPRPEQTAYVETLRTELPFYDLRHLVRPGLTGWAQVKYGYASSTTDSLQKLQYEFWYLRHQRLSLDLRILMRTVRHVLAVGGR